MANNWRTGKLGELVAFKTGKLDSNAAVPNGDYPFFTCSQETLRTNTFSFDTECVLLAGNNANGIFPLKYFHGKFDAYQRTYVIKPRDQEILNTKFLYYTLRPKLSELRSFSTGAATKFLTLTILNDTEIQVPSLPVQRRIAGILSAYDELMENSQRRIRILEEMARALYREWFVHFRFPGHENLPRVASPLGSIPKGWEVKPFTEIADVLSGGTPKTDVAEYWNGEIPFFTPRDVPDCFYVHDTDKHVTELGLSKCASELYPPDTVFITARGTVGKVALPSVPMAMNQSCYALRGKPGIPQRFLFLMTLQQVDYLKTNTGGATFDTIVVDTFRRMEVVKPADEIIVRFTKKTDGIFEQVNTLQRQIQNLRRTRDLLLPRLLWGQVELKTEVA
jgi:type I restriction enzyme S subunit